MTPISVPSRRVREAQTKVAELKAVERDGANWATQYHNKGFIIREHVVETDFQVPSRPKPRDLFVVQATPKEHRPGVWPSSLVVVFRRQRSGEDQRICGYQRNYAMLQTFEPFRQGMRDFALRRRLARRACAPRAGARRPGRRAQARHLHGR